MPRLLLPLTPALKNFAPHKPYIPPKCAPVIVMREIQEVFRVGIKNFEPAKKVLLMAIFVPKVAISRSKATYIDR
jgi:hypothetical protein